MYQSLNLKENKSSKDSQLNFYIIICSRKLINDLKMHCKMLKLKDFQLNIYFCLYIKHCLTS
jgi:hypothetical protein